MVQVPEDMYIKTYKLEHLQQIFANRNIDSLDNNIVCKLIPIIMCTKYIILGNIMKHHQTGEL